MYLPTSEEILTTWRPKASKEEKEASWGKAVHLGDAPTSSDEKLVSTAMEGVHTAAQHLAKAEQQFAVVEGFLKAQAENHKQLHGLTKSQKQPIIVGQLTICWDSSGKVTANGWTIATPQGAVKKFIGRTMLRWLKSLYLMNCWKSTNEENLNNPFSYNPQNFGS